MPNRLQAILDAQAKHRKLLQARAAAAVRREVWMDHSRYPAGAKLNKAREKARWVRQAG